MALDVEKRPDARIELCEGQSSADFAPQAFDLADRERTRFLILVVPESGAGDQIMRLCTSYGELLHGVALLTAACCAERAEIRWTFVLDHDDDDARRLKEDAARILLAARHARGHA